MNVAMNVSWKKVTVGALAALTLGLSLATPASAQYYYRGGGWGWGPGPAVAAGVLGGMALGAAAASAAHPVYGPGPACWVERRPVYDEYGNFIGRRRMRVCQ